MTILTRFSYVTCPQPAVPLASRASKALMMVASLLLLGTLNGCSRMSVNNGSLDYQKARPLAPLQLPQEMQTRPFIQAYPIPETISPSPITVSNERHTRFVMPAPQPLPEAALSDANPASTGAPSTPTLVQDGNGYPVVRIEGDNRQIWSRLLATLSAGSLKVLEQNTSQGWIRLQDTTSGKPVTLHLGASGTATTLTLLNKDGALLEKDAANDIFAVILHNWGQ